MATEKNQGPGATIAILGAGSWGGTLSCLWGNSGKTVRLWTRSSSRAQQLCADRVIEKPLRTPLPDSVSIHESVADAARGASFIVLACSSQAIRAVAREVAEAVGADSGAIIVSAAKGIELVTLLRMSEIIEQEAPRLPVAALSGPNLAVEILRGMPTAAVIGCKSAAAASAAQQQLAAPGVRLYSNLDVAGVELGGTLKNIIAIAAGCSDGLKLGANAKAALMTRGLAEMTRLAVALGAKSVTLAGLSGMGDLLATCNSPLSRNWRLGHNMALGQSRDQALEELGATAEGVTTTEAVCELSKRLGIELPIAEQVERTLKGETTPRGAIMTLMARPLGSE